MLANGRASAAAACFREAGRKAVLTDIITFVGWSTKKKCGDEWQHLKGLRCAQSVSCARG